MVRHRATALLIDLDGVLRRWDPQVAATVELTHGLPAGSLLDTAMRWSLLQPAVTGQISHDRWLDAVVDTLAEASDGDGAARARVRAAVDEWQAHRGAVDPEVLEFVRAVRLGGIRVGLATNATDRLDADLIALELTGEVDVVLNSSALGVHKPAKEYFQRACLAMETPPDRVLLVDDDDRAVRGARVAGLSAYRWNGPADLPYLRAALALPG